MSEHWRRLPLQVGATAPLLAGAEALLAGLDTVRQPALRWYVMEQPSLILGSSQRISEVDLDACEAAGVCVHRRRSGGTAVYTDATLLSLDVALPAGHRLLPQNVTAAYQWFGETWRDTLQRLGVDAYVIDDAAARALHALLDPAVKQVCFGGVSPFEVLVGYRKLVGLAQVRRRPGGLLQAGIYLRWDAGRISSLLQGTPDERQARASLLRERAVGLQESNGQHIDIPTVITTWEQTLQEVQQVELLDDTWTDEEHAAIISTAERYGAVAGSAVTI
jgi:lipoate---protein ligase